MKSNSALSHALDCLAHPLSLAAVAILALNALVFEPNWPSWLTGKLGDLAWMCFVPLLAAVVLALVAPSGVENRQRLVGYAAIILTGLAFAMVKTVPAANLVVARLVGAIIGAPHKLALDPSDLLTLPGLAVALWVWQRPRLPRVAPALRYAFLGAAALAVLADSPAPINYGITCFVQGNNGLLAVHTTSYKGTKSLTYFKSSDGGLSWASIELKPIDESNNQCDKDQANSVSLTDPADANKQYMVVSGQAAYISDDGGATFRRDFVLDKEVLVYDIYYDAGSKNVLVAAGRNGVLARTPDGKWQWAKGLPTGN